MRSPSATSVTSEAAEPAVDERFPKSRRLLKRAEFRAVYDAGNKAPGPYFLIFWRDRGDAEPCRVGLTASRKVGKATTRNRGKRLIREAVRRNWSRTPSGCDAIFHLRRGIGEASYQQVEREVLRLLGKAARRLGRLE